MPEALPHLLLHFSNPIESLMNTHFLPLSVIVYNENLRLYAVRALGQIGTPEAQKAVKEYKQQN